MDRAAVSELDRLIGRLIMVGVRGAEPGEAALEHDLEACAAARVGGVVLFDAEASTGGGRNVRSPGQVAELCGYLRERLGPGLVIAIDQEGGRVARLHPRHGFAAVPAASAYAGLPRADRLAAADGLAEMLAELGIDWNFAPCADLAIERDGGVIGRLGRSFGEDAAAVVVCAREQIEAHHRRGVAVCLKHFPGHGSARGDTHLGLEDITDVWRNDELEPYRRLLGVAGAARLGGDIPPSADRGGGAGGAGVGAEASGVAADERSDPGGIDAVMIGHLVHRGLDCDRPASLSPRVVGGLLRTGLGFGGVVVTDSLDMRAIAERWEPGEAAVLALRAGADVVLDANNPPGPSPSVAAVGPGGSDGRAGEARPCPAPEIHAAVRRALDEELLGVEQIRASAGRIDRLRRRTVGRVERSSRADRVGDLTP